MKAYRELERRFARDAVLGDVTGLLQWDCETMMPEGAAEGRAEQLATVKRIAHELLVCDATQDLLAVAGEEAGALDEAQQANLREMRRSYAHASAVPSDVVEASSRAVSKAENAWRAARRESDFKMLLPHLEEVLRIRREVGAAKGAALGLSPYDALLDSHDPDLRQAKVDPLFDDLRAALPGLVEEACARQQALPPIERPAGPFPTAVQRRLGEMLAQAVGFDLSRGRLDVSLHPFSGGATGDVRITTRYDEDDFAGALMGVLHESGHALYEQGLPRSWAHQPAGAARGMSLHESQSLIIEMQAGRSRAFTRFLAPLLRQALPGRGWPGAPTTCTASRRRCARASYGSTPTRSPIRPTSCSATTSRRR
jgi:carboxypeptidase Taq